MTTYSLESLLRPPVELFTTAVCYVAAALCVQAPWAFALTPLFGIATALGFAYLGTVRLLQARRVLRYQANLRRLPHYTMTSAEMPISNERLFIGRGFRWTQKHTQRLADTYLPQYSRYVEPTRLYEGARWLEERLEFAPFPLKAITKVTSWDSSLNPARPLPPVGGLPRLHGIEPDEQNVSLPLGERVGHTLVLGTTRVGKTRLAEVFITQDIRRTHRRGSPRRMGRRSQTPHRWSRRGRPEQRPDHEVVIVFDPKGDADLLKRMYVECKRAGRLDEFYVFHLGWPDISARYNAIGRFGRISEVATRIAGQLSGEGNSAAFREFAWRFVNIIAQSLVALGRRPDYEQIRRHVINIDELFIEYAQKYFAEHDPKAWETIVALEAKIDRRNLSFAMKDRPLRVVAVDMYLTQKRINDSVMDGLRSAVRYDKTYFDKIVASLLPLLEKLTTGRIAELLAPDYLDLSDQRPIFDWMQVIRKRAVVYIGLDALSDTEVAAAVGNSMFSDLVSVAGHIYKHGIDDGLPGNMAGGKVRINLHADEFNELIGDEFIPMVNKSGGAGMQVTAYTQTMSDIEAKIGSKAKAGQVIGNFNNLFMLRVRETATAELLTNQLPKVQIYNSTPASSANDSLNGKTAFTSSSHDQLQATSVPMIEPAHVVGLPKGQAFALIEGGNLWKIRMPLPANDPDEVMPGNLQDLAAGMRRSSAASLEWWEAPGYQELKSALPEDLVEDFRQAATDDAA
ncbi:conjugative coupling factor TraD, PFGI-1 class [Pseudomonas protegens]|jgi:conjugative coupling factor TraD (TOL family)|uniref:Conjugative coupling factor TraD, PFGI-1 class n=2 Tax=Pseudomonas protegens TaxID=380021 RepID=Q4K7K4_PSEF5|nr:type IV conjugative transfer system coupling protein TraD [Pseudomonas protegens]AAY93935.1 conjugative coupling factor TraD, PFGI-1 class [Pseudomonas protegens Pf-5]ASE21898.1 conjugative coupling factor TraD, PFGI-1 class [Pseudomonas protegens]QEZ54417.1 conjugative coupling factor TraD, PFGI-1 class [Pseudomonas protegens]QEZ59379.1 conjugative coupling factor TraD, PFGI-1 class [Pseudomonas protegens]QEZ65704.1 conjugative coupling factor TraD, PFGI-1 class [Pseudomonas protegens]